MVVVDIMDLVNLSQKRSLQWASKAIEIALLLAERSKPAATILYLCVVRKSALTIVKLSIACLHYQLAILANSVFRTR